MKRRKVRGKEKWNEVYTVSEKDCTLFLFIFLKKVQSFSATLADNADLRRTVRTADGKFVCLCRTAKNAFGNYVWSRRRKKGESMTTEINTE